MSFISHTTPKGKHILYNLARFDEVYLGGQPGSWTNKNPKTIVLFRMMDDENKDKVVLHYKTIKKAKTEFKKIKLALLGDNDQIKKLEEKIEELTNALLYISTSGYKGPGYEEAETDYNERVELTKK